MKHDWDECVKLDFMGRPWSALGWFVPTAGAILLLTGVAKILSGLGHARVLGVADPVLGLSFGKLMLAVGATEVIISCTCFFPRVNQRLNLGLVAWLATNFLVYRIGLSAMGWRHPCHCMGALAGTLHLSDQAADNIMKGVLAYLLVGSYVLVVAQWRQRRAQGPAAGPRQAKGTVLVA